MKKQEQVERDQEEVVNKAFTEQVNISKEAKKKKAQRNETIVKYFRLLQIAGMVLVCITLVKQNAWYFRGLGMFATYTTGERLWQLVFRSR